MSDMSLEESKSNLSPLKDDNQSTLSSQFMSSMRTVDGLHKNQKFVSLAQKEEISCLILVDNSSE